MSAFISERPSGIPEDVAEYLDGSQKMFDLYRKNSIAAIFAELQRRFPKVVPVTLARALFYYKENPESTTIFSSWYGEHEKTAGCARCFFHCAKYRVGYDRVQRKFHGENCAALITEQFVRSSLENVESSTPRYITAHVQRSPKARTKAYQLQLVTSDLVRIFTQNTRQCVFAKGTIDDIIGWIKRRNELDEIRARASGTPEDNPPASNETKIFFKLTSVISGGRYIFPSIDATELDRLFSRKKVFDYGIHLERIKAAKRIETMKTIENVYTLTIDQAMEELKKRMYGDEVQMAEALCKGSLDLYAKTYLGKNSVFEALEERLIIDGVFA